MSDNLGNDRRFVEDDLNALHDIDKEIAKLIELRKERVSIIKEQLNKNNERLYASDDWFEGNVRGNPVPDRGGEVAYADGPYDEPSKARRY